MNFTRRFFVILINLLVCLTVSPWSANASQIDEIARLPFGEFNETRGVAFAEDANGDTWVKHEISPSLLNTPIVLQIPSVHVSDYTLFVYEEGRLVEVPKNIGPLEREYRSRFPIHLFTPSHTVVYLNIGKQPRGKVQILTCERSDFVHQEVADIMRNNLYYGLVIMSILFHILFYFVFREKRLLIYAGLQLSLLFIFFYLDGLFHFLTGGVWNAEYFLVWNIAVCSTLSNLFIYYFLDLYTVPGLRTMAISIMLVLFSSVLIYTVTGSIFFRALISVFCYLLPGISLYHAIRMFKENAYARFLVMTFGILALVCLGYTMNIYTDVVYLPYFGVNTIRLVSLIEILAITFVLIFKVKDLQEENEQYSRELRQYLELLNEQSREKHELPANISLPSAFPDILKSIAEQYQLTDREGEVLACLWNGDSNADIASKLHISVNTAKFHVSRLYTKLEVKNRSEVRLLKSKHDSSTPILQTFVSKTINSGDFNVR